MSEHAPAGRESAQPFGGVRPVLDTGFLKKVRNYYIEQGDPAWRDHWRHGPEKNVVARDPAGWVKIEDIMKKRSIAQWDPTWRHLIEAVLQGDKLRLELGLFPGEEKPSLIRTIQGHSGEGFHPIAAYGEPLTPDESISFSTSMTLYSGSPGPAVST